MVTKQPLFVDDNSERYICILIKQKHFNILKQHTIGFIFYLQRVVQ